MKLSAELGADAVELHTGRYCLATQALRPEKKKVAREIDRIEASGRIARRLGLKVHAGHGFDFVNVRPVAERVDEAGRPLIEEYNIGHSIVCRAAIVGLDRAVKEMVSAIRAP
jgi:pyridoxine 5-phosphate synthase